MPLICPACGSDHTRSARLYTSDGLKRRLLYTPHRCRECRHRFWRLNPAKPLLFTLLVALLGGVAVWRSLPSERPAVQSLARLDTLKQRAQGGDADAQVKMGMRYQLGDGVDASPTEAAQWFLRAARKGNLEAQFLYGLALLEGRGVVQDYNAAFRWIDEAARRGHARAQVALADMYRFGSGVKADNARAYLWYNLAAAQGDENAARSRDNVASRLTPEELTAMQNEARRILGAPVPAAPAP